MKKAMALTCLFAAVAAVAAAQPILRDAPGYKPFEIAVFGGLSIPQIKGTTDYADSWSYNLLKNVDESTAIATRAKKGFAVAGSFSYFFGPRFGAQVLLGYMTSDVPNTADVNFAWTWTTDNSSFRKKASWAGTGQLTSMPFSLNLIGRVGSDPFDILVSGGLTYFAVSFKADSAFSYGITTVRQVYVAPDYVNTQYVDALKVGLMIGTTRLNSLGANIGAGITYRISEGLGIKADARYYFTPKKNLSWQFVKGNYDGVFFSDLKGEPFSDADIDFLNQNNKKFEIMADPSFFQISLGIVLFLGGNENY